MTDWMLTDTLHIDEEGERHYTFGLWNRHTSEQRPLSQWFMGRLYVADRLLKHAGLDVFRWRKQPYLLRFAGVLWLVGPREPHIGGGASSMWAANPVTLCLWGADLLKEWLRWHVQRPILSFLYDHNIIVVPENEKFYWRSLPTYIKRGLQGQKNY